MQVEHLNRELREARRLSHRMNRSLSWRLTWPLRVLHDAGTATLKKVKRRDELQFKSLVGSAETPIEADQEAELLRTIFDEAYYLKQVPDAADIGLSPLEHYRTIGWHQAYNPHPLFDVSWYLSENGDVANAGTDPLLHYLEYGWKEGRNPHPSFDVKGYLAENADVLQAGVEPLNHYCNHGRKEGRKSHPVPFVGETELLCQSTIPAAIDAQKISATLLQCGRL